MRIVQGRLGLGHSMVYRAAAASPCREGKRRLSQSTNTLDVGEAAKTAFASIWLHRRRLAAWAVAPALLVAVIDLMSQPFVAGLDDIVRGEPGADWRSGAVVAGLLSTALQLAAWTVLELICYRLFLLGPGAEPPASGLRAIYLSLLTFNLALTALILVPSIGLDYLRIVDGRPEMEFLSFVYYLLYIFVSVRLAFAFPAISLGWGWGLRERWRETGSNVWRLLLLFVLAFSPIIALTALLSGAGFDLSGYALSNTVPPVLEALARALVNLTLLLVTTAAIAAAVAQITGFRAAGMTGQGPGPTDIAARFD